MPNELGRLVGALTFARRSPADHTRTPRRRPSGQPHTRLSGRETDPRASKRTSRCAVGGARIFDGKHWTAAQVEDIELAAGPASMEPPMEARIARLEADVAHLVRMSQRSRSTCARYATRWTRGSAPRNEVRRETRRAQGRNATRRHRVEKQFASLKDRDRVREDLGATALLRPRGHHARDNGARFRLGLGDRYFANAVSFVTRARPMSPPRAGVSACAPSRCR